MKAETIPQPTLFDANLIYRKITFKVMPLLFIAYVVCYLDRVNIGFAKLRMQADVGLTDSAYGRGAGIFFVGYVLFQIPGNLITMRLGARRWISFCMISWGIVSAATMFVDSEQSFLCARFLLGVAEAGFAPAVVYFISRWFPSSRRASITALWLMAVATSSAIGAPMSSWILWTFDHNGIFAGWQWLLLLEGIPSIALALLTYVILDDEIDDAKWLNSSEKCLLHMQLALHERGTGRSTFAAFHDWRTLVLASVNFTILCGLYAISFWLPQIIRDTQVTNLMSIGVLAAIPWTVAGLGMLPMSRSSDSTGDRRKHLAFCCLLGAVGLGVTPILSSTCAVLALAALSVATLGVLAALPIFWTMPTALFGGTSTAPAIATVNALGQLGGFAAPYIIGWSSDRTHSTAAGLYWIVGALVVGALLSLFLPSELDEPYRRERDANPATPNGFGRD